MNLYSKGVIYFFATATAVVSTDRAFAGDSVKVCVQVVQKDVRPKPEELSVDVKNDNSADKAMPESLGAKAEDATPNGISPNPSAPPTGGFASKPTATKASSEQNSAQIFPVDSSSAGNVPTDTSPTGTSEENWDRVIRDRRKSLVYIKRLIEYYVTHEPGYEAVSEDCEETILVELYPITDGWTAFARFSQNGREERVDSLTADELSPFAERSVLALLHDVPISETIARDTVLKSDSKKARQKIRGNSHFTMTVGTDIRGGYFDTAITDESNPNVGGVEKKVRVMAPMLAAIGYRGRFETWGIENRLNLLIGTEKTAANKNPLGGHADFSVGTGLSLHVFRYAKPRGLTSFYYGAGGTFELLWFSGINAAGASESRSRLVSGGLTVDGVLGVEFMRASSVQFYIQGDLNLPAYMVSRENAYTLIHTWFPGVTIQLGIMF